MTHLARLAAEEVTPVLEEDGEGGGGVVVLHGGHIVVPHLNHTSAGTVILTHTLLIRMKT